MDSLESLFRTKQQDRLRLVTQIHLNKGWCGNHMRITLSVLTNFYIKSEMWQSHHHSQ